MSRSDLGSAALAWRDRLGALGLGAAQLGNLFHTMPDEVANEILETAWSAGVRYFDTAPHYGLGLSERRLGRFLAGKPRDSFVISTKAGRRLVPSPETAGQLDGDAYVVAAATRRVWDPTESGIRAGLEESLERLGLDRVDILYLHDPDEYDLESSLRTGIPALVRLREEGLVGAIGIGSKDVPAILAAVRTDALDLVMVAGRYTVLEPSGALDLLAECSARGVGVVAAAVFNSGLLSTREVAAGAMYEYRPASQAVVDRARALAAICGEFDVDLPTAAIQFPLRHPAVSTVVAGAAGAEHVRQNVDRLTAEVPAGLWDRLPAGPPAASERLDQETSC